MSKRKQRPARAGEKGVDTREREGRKEGRGGRHAARCARARQPEQPEQEERKQAQERGHQPGANQTWSESNQNNSRPTRGNGVSRAHHHAPGKVSLLRVHVHLEASLRFRQVRHTEHGNLDHPTEVRLGGVKEREKGNETPQSGAGGEGNRGMTGNCMGVGEVVRSGKEGKKRGSRSDVTGGKIRYISGRKLFVLKTWECGWGRTTAQASSLLGCVGTTWRVTHLNYPRRDHSSAG